MDRYTRAELRTGRLQIDELIAAARAPVFLLARHQVVRPHGKLAHLLSGELHSQAKARGLHATGEFNLGREDDYRMPDMGWTSAAVEDSALYVPSVEVVVEIGSTGDETWAKVPFYLAHGVVEVWVITPTTRTVRLLTGMDDDETRSTALDVSLAEIRAALGWD